MKTFLKIIINAIFSILSIFFGIACIMSFFIDGKYPKADNIQVFGALSLFFLILLFFWDKWPKKPD